MGVEDINQFKKDLKRYQNKPKQIAQLKEVLSKLKENGVVPKEYKPHMLIGEYRGFTECHIESDTLLIWLDETENQIKSWNDIQELQNKIMIQNEEMTGVAVINFIQLD